MPIAKITGQGLLGIACAVALLWIFVVEERSMMREALAERAAVMRVIEIEQQRRNPQPVSRPAIVIHAQRPTIG